ncbi:MAG TPA: hypothetical protein VJX66_07150 [Amycolatopsis sp.]|nr:hypothetical protein [Amycolatopsis sp.]
MAEKDLLSELLRAWRADIESVPFPQFSELLIPRQRREAADHQARRVTKTTPGRDS